MNKKPLSDVMASLVEPPKDVNLDPKSREATITKIEQTKQMVSLAKLFTLDVVTVGSNFLDNKNKK